jgi:stage II sporulation protein AA (anti-sigma F factor antagonist)
MLHKFDIFFGIYALQYIHMGQASGRTLKRMPLETISDGTKLLARLSGELDHHSAEPLRSGIDEALHAQKPAVLELDFGEVSFCDSSAVGLVMGRFRAAHELNCALEVSGLSPIAFRMMRMSGLERLCKISPKAGTALPSGKSVRGR